MLQAKKIEMLNVMLEHDDAGKDLDAHDDDQEISLMNMPGVWYVHAS